MNRACRPSRGLCCSGRNPQRWLLDARISAVRIPGTQPSLELSDRKEIGGRLLDQIEGAQAFLQRHLSEPSRVSGWVRKELGIPAPVLREAVVNALSHRDYRMSAQTRLLVFDDRLEVTNPGALLNRLTVDSIRLGITQRRNPVIASLLARAHRRENIGFGLQTMFSSMLERGLPPPEITTDGGHFRLVLRLRPPA